MKNLFRIILRQVAKEQFEPSWLGVFVNPFYFARKGLLINIKEFEVIEYKKTANDITVIFQLLNAYIYKKIIGRNYYINLCKTIIFMAPFNVLGVLLALILPKNNDLYLDNIILAKKVLDA